MEKGARETVELRDHDNLDLPLTALRHEPIKLRTRLPRSRDTFVHVFGDELPFALLDVRARPFTLRVERSALGLLLCTDSAIGRCFHGSRGLRRSLARRGLVALCLLASA